MKVSINAVTPGVGDYCLRVSHFAIQRRSSLRKSRSESPGVNIYTSIYFPWVVLENEHAAFFLLYSIDEKMVPPRRRLKSLLSSQQRSFCRIIESYYNFLAHIHQVVLNPAPVSMLWLKYLGALFLRSLPVLDAGAASTNSLQDVVCTLQIVLSRLQR
jgi:hypothetical protein